MAWHEGERAAQARVGTRERSDRAAPSLHPRLTEQHRSFFQLLPFVAVASMEPGGAAWASLLVGRPGFMQAPDPTTLCLAARPPKGDPLTAALRPGARLGLLGVQLETRRRNRVNGRVTAVKADGFTLAVEQAFGNCPKYIASRTWVDRETRPVDEPIATLDEAAGRLLARADTAFVASATGPGGDADCSHRGGRPGFLALAADGAVIVPDYAGNGFFNTLGNLLLHPRAGLAVPDFASGDLLQLSGTVDIQWQVADTLADAGIERLWRFVPEHGQWLRNAFAPQAVGEPSPFSPMPPD